MGRRIYAFAVLPQHGLDNPKQPEGRRVARTEVIRALDRATENIRLEDQTRVDLITDGQRNNATRSAVMRFAFSTNGPAVRAAAAELALKLSCAMDKRMKPALFFADVQEDEEVDGVRRVTLWLFPHDEAFRFPLAQATQDVEFLTDIFSANSNLRKAALFSGFEANADFYQAHVLDKQASSAPNRVANYWLQGFLEGRPNLDGDGGTHLLADCLRSAMSAAVTEEEKENVTGALFHARHSNRRDWSVKALANECFGEGPLREAFLKPVAKRPELASQRFELDRGLLKEILPNREFHVEMGVRIMAPPNAIGPDGVVQVEGEGDQKRLRVDAAILDEKTKKAPRRRG